MVQCCHIEASFQLTKTMDTPVVFYIFISDAVSSFPNIYWRAYYVPLLSPFCVYSLADKWGPRQESYSWRQIPPHSRLLPVFFPTLCVSREARPFLPPVPLLIRSSLRFAVPASSCWLSSKNSAFLGTEQLNSAIGLIGPKWLAFLLRIRGGVSGLILRQPSWLNFYTFLQSLKNRLHPLNSSFRIMQTLGVL